MIVIPLFLGLSVSLVHPKGHPHNLTSDATYHTFQQFIDHENHDLGKFDQRYANISTYYKKGGPVIIDIAGESRNFKPSGNNDFVEVLAKEFKAAVFTLEHRYFGVSQPFEKTTTENLQYLTVAQAIEDYAEFRNYILKTLPEPKTKFLITGGSYSGLLSAYARKVHPELFDAAISSSGVVEAIEDFKNFDLQDSISMGQICSDVSRNVRMEIDKILDSGNEADKAYLMNLFEAPELEEDVFRFVVGEMFTLPLQYGHLSEYCGAMVSAHEAGQDLISALATFSRNFFAPKFTAGGLMSYSNKVLKDTKAGPENDGRCWLWMTCNELAYWQTNSGRLSLRSPKLDTEFFFGQCKEVFDGLTTKPDVAAFNAKYGGLKVNVDHVYFTTSSQDPWTWACVTEESGVPAGSFAHTIIGPEVGHCSDLHQPKDTDPVDLKNTREHMMKVLAQWLAPDKE